MFGSPTAVCAGTRRESCPSAEIPQAQATSTSSTDVGGMRWCFMLSRFPAGVQASAAGARVLTVQFGGRFAPRVNVELGVDVFDVHADGFESQG